MASLGALKRKERKKKEDVNMRLHIFSYCFDKVSFKNFDLFIFFKSKTCGMNDFNSTLRRGDSGVFTFYLAKQSTLKHSLRVPYLSFGVKNIYFSYL